MNHHLRLERKTRVVLIKRVKLIQEFEEVLEGGALLKVGLSGPESVI